MATSAVPAGALPLSGEAARALFADVSLVVQSEGGSAGEPAKTILSAHRAVLSASCRVFYRMFCEDLADAAAGGTHKARGSTHKARTSKASVRVPCRGPLAGGG